MLNISAFYLLKQKTKYSYKKYDLGRSQYQNKKALFTDPIFSNGFGWHARVFVSSNKLKFTLLVQDLLVIVETIKSRSDKKGPLIDAITQN